jgi:hypothetical protein
MRRRIRRADLVLDQNRDLESDPENREQAAIRFDQLLR